MHFPAVIAPRFAVEIRTEGSGKLLAAIELVSPASKDQPAGRRLFAAKCATYLSGGIGLIVVDVVTSRQGNLHNELIDLLGLDATYHMPPQPALYTVAYRPLQIAGTGQIETWPQPLTVGQTLPTMPLSLEAELCVPVDLEAAYDEACRRRRFDEVVG
jgi:hypothetical protein